MAIPAKYTFANDFSEGLAVVKNGDYFLYIDIHGNSVLSPHFKLATSFKDGKAIVISNEKEVFIDKKGNIVGEVPSHNER